MLCKRERTMMMTGNILMPSLTGSRVDDSVMIYWFVWCLHDQVYVIKSGRAIQPVNTYFCLDHNEVSRSWYSYSRIGYWYKYIEI